MFPNARNPLKLDDERPEFDSKIPHKSLQDSFQNQWQQAEDSLNERSKLDAVRDHARARANFNNFKNPSSR